LRRLIACEITDAIEGIGGSTELVVKERDGPDLDTKLHAVVAL
jgi:hypothetical protein